MDWQSIETAPKDGTLIRVKTKGGYTFAASWQGGLLNRQGDECGGWHAQRADEAPPCWTDGVCWTFNAEGKRSAPPTHWLPTPPEDGPR